MVFLQLYSTTSSEVCHENENIRVYPFSFWIRAVEKIKKVTFLFKFIPSPTVARIAVSNACFKTKKMFARFSLHSPTS